MVVESKEVVHSRRRPLLQIQAGDFRVANSIRRFATLLSNLLSFTLAVSTLSFAATMGPKPNARILRDISAREMVKQNEIARRAYLYVARNQALPPQVRYQAQLQLNNFHLRTRPSCVRNRCTESGKGRGIINEFGLCRVSICV